MNNPRHDAMTSEQVRLIWMRLLLPAVVIAVLAGCQKTPVEHTLTSPYNERQVWAVAPLRNETGSRHANGLVMADELTRVFENVQGIDALPVNRVLEAMDAWNREHHAED